MNACIPIRLRTELTGSNLQTAIVKILVLLRFY